LGGETNELLLLGGKGAGDVRKRVLERPDALPKFARLDDQALDRVLECLAKKSSLNSLPGR
jgi:hypothetical protein